MHAIGKVVFWAFLAIVALIVVVFCWANREAVTVSLYPLPWVFTEIPLFIWLFAMVVVGILLGVVVAWVAGHDVRRLSGERKRRVRELERLLAEADRREQRSLPPDGDTMALPPSRDAA